MRENRTADAAMTGMPGGTGGEGGRDTDVGGPPGGTEGEGLLPESLVEVLFTFGALPCQVRWATSTYERQVLPV